MRLLYDDEIYDITELKNAYIDNLAYDTLAYFCEMIVDEIDDNEVRKAYKRQFSAYRRGGDDVETALYHIRVECLQDDLFFDLYRIAKNNKAARGLRETYTFYGVTFYILY